MTTTATNAAKRKIRNLVKEYDRTVRRYTDSLFAGRQHAYYAARQGKLKRLAVQIAGIARRHGLVDWAKRI